MTGEAKALIGIGVVTLVMFVGGIMALNRNRAPEAVEFDPAILVRDDSYALEGENSRLTLVEFADYQCPFCAQSHPLVQQILSEHGEELTYVYRHFPLLQHQHALLAAQAAEAAGAQGKFWEMNDLLFAGQDDWAEADDALPIFQGYAEQLSLDVDQFTEAIENQQFLAKVQRDSVDGTAAGVNSTPTFFVNGEQFPGSVAALQAYIESQLAEQPIEASGEAVTQ